MRYPNPHRVLPVAFLSSLSSQANTYAQSLFTQLPTLTMFARAAAFSLLALPIFAAATPVRRGNCNTGSIQCCNSVESTDNNAVSALLGLLGVTLEGITGSVGLQCSPLQVVGLGGGNACSQQPVCCQNNNVGGLISIGCVPIEL
ncbi:fungal hydrophobin-domain-containing protein [Dichomitus squalens]|uniref:Hydrophobin n=1 Tax=Dichomitus squalens TaxID=114155 RepID=A0A4Q9MLG1_9APHY|nr:fungal hydrophobin-domain-containing protein [Dichomitus squalens]